MRGGVLGSFGHAPNILALIVRSAPLLFMYMIDLQLWFMLWTALWGSVAGFSLRIGEVRPSPWCGDSTAAPRCALTF